MSRYPLSDEIHVAGDQSGDPNDPQKIRACSVYLLRNLAPIRRSDGNTPPSWRKAAVPISTPLPNSILHVLDLVFPLQKGRYLSKPVQIRR